MLLFSLIFQVIILFITVLCHKMVEVRYKQIQESMRIFTNSRAYRTNSKVCFIEDVLERYKTYVEIKGKSPILETMIEGELYKYKIGKFSFIGVNNIALKSKIIMRYVIGLQMIIMVINNQIEALDCIVILFSGIMFTISTEIFVIINALDKKEVALICEIKDYILHKYPVELYTREVNKKISARGTTDKEVSKDENSKSNTYKEIRYSNVKNNKKESNESDIQLTSRDIEKMIVSMELKTE